MTGYQLAHEMLEIAKHYGEPGLGALHKWMEFYGLGADCDASEDGFFRAKFYDTLAEELAKLGKPIK